jgi:hypothetical protein
LTVTKELHPIKDVLIKNRGDLYGDPAGYVKRGGRHYPIRAAYVVKDALKDFTGPILEYYNLLPLQGGPLGMARSVSVYCRFVCKNLASYSRGQDEFGVFAQQVDEYGFPVIGADGYIHTLGSGVFASEQTQGEAGQSYIGSNVSGSISFHASGAPRLWVYFIGDLVPFENRSKDMVCWIYASICDVDGSRYGHDSTEYTYLEGTIDDYNVFAPGQSGTRFISNRWKYAPWERYPDL